MARQFAGTYGVDFKVYFNGDLFLLLVFTLVTGSYVLLCDSLSVDDVDITHMLKIKKNKVFFNNVCRIPLLKASIPTFLQRFQ